MKLDAKYDPLRFYKVPIRELRAAACLADIGCRKAGGFFVTFRLRNKNESIWRRTERAALITALTYLS